jgi:hypothetical protein
MAKMLTIDLRALDEFKHAFTSPKAKGRFFGAIRNTINDQAKLTTLKSKKSTIPGSMITRGKFNQNSVWTTFAKGREMTSFSGARKNFGKARDYMGLASIELGTTEDNAGVPTVEGSRGGSKSRKVKKAARYPQLSNAVTLPSGRPKQTLAILSNRGYKQPIRIRKNQINKLKPGYYKFVGKKHKRTNGRFGFNLLMIKDLELRKTKVKKKSRWLLRATASSTSPRITNKLFIDNVKKKFEGFNK